PLPRYSLDTPLVGLHREPGQLRGHWAPPGGGKVRLSVEVPSPGEATVEVDGNPVQPQAEGPLLSIPLDLSPGQRVEWRIRSPDL
ncbi:MAG: hypothetical protein HY558_05175, partial [Euryarchaeota archaeon]|nr:hypothetical protein [Euryarchaeota archaeon]